MQVREVMTTPVITVTPETPFTSIIELMLDHDVSGLPVVDASGVIVGVVTEADLISKEAFDQHGSRVLHAMLRAITGERSWADRAQGLTAKDLMTAGVHTAAASDSVGFAARMMLDFGVKRLPVVERGRLAGIISRVDLLRVLRSQG